MQPEDSEAEGIYKVWLYTRYVLSTILTLSCLILILYAIGHGYAALDGHPVPLMLIFFFVVALLAYLEGLQIAIMTLINVNRSEFRHLPRAYTNHKLSTANHGLNVQRFLVGRQFFVVFVVFLAAQLTTYSEMEIDWLPNFLYVFIIQTGMPGVLFVLSFGQLMPQLVASTHPVTFMNLPGSWSVIQMALFFEAAGVTHFSWVLTIITKFFCKLNSPDISSWSREVSRNNLSKKSKTSRTNKIVPGGSAFNSFLTSEKFDLEISNFQKSSLNNLQPWTADDFQGLNWLHHKSAKDAFDAWGIDSTNMTAWPSKRQVVTNLCKKDELVPTYLLPTNHREAVPDYLCVMELLRLEGLSRNNESKYQN